MYKEEADSFFIKSGECLYIIESGESHLLYKRERVYLLYKYREERLFLYLLFVVEDLASSTYREGRRSLPLKEKESTGKESYSSL